MVPRAAIGIAVFILELVCCCVRAATYHVDVLNGDDAAAGTNWATAKFSIQAGVGLAGDGDTVLVSDGVYALTSGVVMTKGILLRSTNGAQNAIIDGRYPFATNQCLNATHSNAVVDGFTITGGFGLEGGGVFLHGGATLQNCVIESNRAVIAGAGIYSSVDGIIRSCSILSNTAVGTADGGGVYTYLGGRIERCLIRGNTARVGGGVAGMFHGFVENCLVVGNTAGQGGGIHCSQYTGIRNCTIAGNNAQTGGGIDAFFGGRIENSIVYFNTAAQGSNVFVRASPDNGASFIFSCTAPLPMGEGNTNADPLFVNMAAGDFRLQASSACMDAASSAVAPTNDLAGETRPLDGNGDSVPVPDMGSYEYRP